MEQRAKTILTKSKGAGILNTPGLPATGFFSPCQERHGKAAWAMRLLPLWSLFFFLLWGSFLANAAAKNPKTDLTEMGIEDLMKVEIATVKGASGYEQDVTVAPSSVTIITADHISKYGYRTLADILRSARSFFVSYDRNYAYLGVRGFSRPTDYNTRVLLLIDGHRINDNIYDTAPIGTESILDVDLIDRVEIIRGPGSSLYGSNAFFGVISVITKKGRDIKGIQGSAEVGGYKTYKGRLTYGNQFANGAEFLLSGTGYGSKGDENLFYPEYAAPETNNGFAQNRDWDRSYSLFSTFSYEGFTLQGAYINRDKAIPTGSYGADFNAPGNQTTDAHGYIDARYQRSFANHTQAQARLFYDSFYYRGDYIYSSVTDRDQAWGKWGGGEVNFVTTYVNKNKIAGGIFFQNNFQQDQSNYDDSPYALRMNDQRNSNVWALYLQDEISLLKNLTLNLGVRHDHYSTFGGTTNPRTALIYAPLEKTFLKLIYGTAFRPPNVYENFYNDSGISQKGNAALQPETIQTYEFVLEQYLGKNLRGTASLYYYKIRNLIEQKSDPADGMVFFDNHGTVEGKGVEFELAGKWENGVEGRVSYAYQKAKNTNTDSELTNSPNNLAKLNVLFPLIRKNIFTGIELQYNDTRKTLAGNEANSYLIANLTLLGRNLMKGLDVSASVYNLFDKKYSDPGGAEHRQDLISQNGINFRFKLTYTY